MLAEPGALNLEKKNQILLNFDTSELGISVLDLKSGTGKLGSKTST